MSEVGAASSPQDADRARRRVGRLRASGRSCRSCPPERDLPRSEVGQRVLPAYESKTGFVSLIMVTTQGGELSPRAQWRRHGGEWVLRRRAPIRSARRASRISTLRCRPSPMARR